MIGGGANIDFIDDWGNTALITAAMTENMNSIEELIKNNANWNITDKNGFDFFDIMRIGSSNFKYDNILHLERKYPEKYKDYLMKKEASKYNL